MNHILGILLSQLMVLSYVEGVILTHGTSPRTHIWTFVAAIDEVSGYYQEKCPCSNVDLTQTAPIPPWVGNDYFCDSGTRNVNSDWNRFQPEDPLWDGMHLLLVQQSPLVPKATILAHYE